MECMTAAHTLQKAFLCDSELNSFAKLYLQRSVPLHCTYAHIQLLIKAMAFVLCLYMPYIMLSFCRNPIFE